MGSNSSRIKSNSNVSNSEKQSLNSAKIGLENMKYTSENSHETITRVWIAKKACELKNIQSLALYEISEYKPSEDIKDILENNNISIPEIQPLKPNLLNIDNGIKVSPKHWAIILELSNNTYVNIQFGRTGFSLKEFSNGERCLNVYLAISETWGERNYPLSFCYLGKNNFSYGGLLKYLIREKEKESNDVNKKGRIWYNLVSSNCQHFACKIEKLIFHKKKIFHFFPYYLEDFYEKFFNINKIEMNKFESALKNKIDIINREIYENNIKNIGEYATVCNQKLSNNVLLQVKNDLINKSDSQFIRSEINQLFS